MSHFNKIFYTLIICALCAPLAAQQPEEIIKQLLAKTETNALKADYTLSVTETDGTAPMVYRGNLLLQGDKFRLEADGMDIAFDGKTQWAYMEDVEEINITEPTPEEAASINPILLAKNIAGNCRMQFSATQKAADKYVIDLFPNNQTDIKKLSLTLRKTDLMPTAISLRSNNGMLADITLREQKFTPALPPATFRLSHADYPDALINDLR